jgi:RHS repeat-associated protein
VLGETFGNGILGTYTHDMIGLTKTLSLQKGQDLPLFGLGITRTKYGAPTIVTDTVPTGLDQKAEYVYDGAARLRNATLGQDGAAQWHFRYQYDGLQNMTGRTQQGPNATDTIGILAGEYHYGENGQGPRQLSRILDNDCGGAVTNFLYDGAGRMTHETSSTGSKVLSYDGYDQLLSVTLPGGGLMKAAYGYDGLRTYSNGKEGEQFWFTAAYTLAPTAKRWHYVSVGDRLVARLTFDNQHAALDELLGIVSPVRDFTIRLNRHAPMLFVYVLTSSMLILLVIGLRRRPAWKTVPAVASCYALLLAMASCEPEAARRSLEVNNSRLYFHQGMAAGPTLITDGGGAIKEERRFEPFGQPVNGTLNKTVDPTNNLNKETNPDTGWSYHGARWMAPQMARWTAPDPAVKSPDNKFMAEPWGTNPYGYVNQNPAMFWDPDGHAAVIYVGQVVELKEDQEGTITATPIGFDKQFSKAATRLKKELKKEGVETIIVGIIKYGNKIKTKTPISSSIVMTHGNEDGETAPFVYWKENTKGVLELAAAPHRFTLEKLAKNVSPKGLLIPMGCFIGTDSDKTKETSGKHGITITSWFQKVMWDNKKGNVGLNKYRMTSPGKFVPQDVVGPMGEPGANKSILEYVKKAESEVGK